MTASSIRVAAVRNLQDEDDLLLVVDALEHAVIAHAKAIVTGELDSERFDVGMTASVAL